MTAHPGLHALTSERRRFANIAGIHAAAIREHETRIAGHRSERDAAEREVERIDRAIAEIRERVPA